MPRYAALCSIAAKLQPLGFVDVDHLTGAPIQACDLRAGAALVIAALAAKGESEISCVQYIERGYEDIVTKLQGLGASIRTVEVPGESEELEAHIG